ncbi:tetratricopeptide repeat protein, partial [Vibrio vulnificus]|uniref:tetratricopeptide repeat protein n=1 Tax=Vibrio vulnificus TaxID=672 RepID=UPI0019D4A9E7
GIVLVQARRFDEALQVYQAAQAVEPSREIPHFSLGYAYAGKGMYSEAAKHFEISAERLGGLQKTSQPLIYLAAAYANIP